MLAIVADLQRIHAPRPLVKPAPVKSQLLELLSRHTLSARQLAERTGIDERLVIIHLAQMKHNRQIYEVYRRVIWADDRAHRNCPKRFLVRYYKAREL